MKKYSAVTLLLALLAIITAAFAFICIFDALPPEILSGGTEVTEELPETDPELLREELAVTVSGREELEELDRYINLIRLDLSGSTCYRDILDYIASHPDVEVSYNVSLPSESGELVLPHDVRSVVLADPALVRQLAEHAAFLPQIESITAEKSGFSQEDLSALESAYPDSEILFIFGKDIPPVSPSAEALDLTLLAPGESENAAGFMALMPQLASVVLTDAEGGNLLSLQEAYPVVAAAPQADIDYRFESFGVEVSVMDETVEYYGNRTGYIYDSGLSEIEQMLPCLPRLKTLYFEFCEIDYDLLAQFRESHPEISVVWRIMFGPYSCRTDREMIYADGSLNSDLCYNLRYCNKVKYIDLGHNNLTTIDFAAYMPELEVGIFAAGDLYDISPLANCPNLTYLEIFVSNVTDISPLANCTKLEHLNISYTRVSDLSPLYNLTSLKRVWCAGGARVPKAQREEIQELLPDCEFYFGNSDSTGNHWRYAKDGSKVDTYEWLSSIFGYDNWRDYITYW